MAHRAYAQIPNAVKSKDWCQMVSESGRKTLLTEFLVPPRCGRAWELKKGQICRFTLPDGPQVGDVNLWNLHDFQERFYSGKTRQIHRAHLSTGCRLWSNMPHLRPLATVTADSLEGYSMDEEGCGVHDILGTRCDPYMHRLITGEHIDVSCHQLLIQAIQPWNMTEYDVHDAFNIFMSSGIDPRTGDYLIKGTPAKQGDFIEIFAEIDLLVALSTCPYGAVSSICGSVQLHKILCFPMEISIGQPEL